MYKLHLIRKYLLKRRIAWVALIAVMLCTAMVLVVVSVMGGWLETFENSFHGMTGDVVVEADSLAGFPYYDEMIRRVTAEVPDAVAAVPVVKSGGLINIGGQIITLVQVVGYPPNIATVNDWPTTLNGQAGAIAAGKPPSFDLLPTVRYEELVPPKGRRNARSRPGMIVTGPLVGIRHDDPGKAAFYRNLMVEKPVTLTLIPVAGGESIVDRSAVTVPFWIVDDCKSRVFQLDNENVYVSFDEAQKALRMDPNGAEPARCSEVEIKARPGADLRKVRDAVQRVADSVTDAHGSFSYYGYKVQTWEDQQGAFIHAVQNEVVLTTVLFGIISMVAVLLIFCIFYMIVVEKTKDIGILKSVGATGGGVLAMFLGYGAAIGLVGAGLGFTIAFFFVRYINELHAGFGRLTGHPIWTAETYQFERIPSHMKADVVAWVLGIAVLSALVGAFLPALRAARMNPVNALRYE